MKEHDFGRFRGIAVAPRRDEHPDKFIKRFMKRVRNDGILQEYRESQSYDKPSVRRRRKAARARFLRRLEEREG